MPLAELIPLVQDLSPAEKLSLLKILVTDIPDVELQAVFSTSEHVTHLLRNSEKAARILATMADPDDEPAGLVLDSLKQAWEELQAGQTRSLSELWDDEDK